MSATAGEVASTKKEFVTLSKSVETINKAGDDDKFQAIMSSFTTKATEEIDVLGTAFTGMEADYKELVDFYGEDVKTDPSEVLGTFLKFMESFDAAVKENEAARMAAEKNAKREAAKKLKEEEDEKKKKALADKKPGSGGQNEAVVDDLLSNITSGSMFQNRARRAPAANPAQAQALKLPALGPMGAKGFALKPTGSKAAALVK